jgi:RHS repeat-associated protein
LRIDGDRFTEDITHTTGWNGAVGYYDGRIKTTSFVYNWTGKPADYAVQYTYDDVGQLTSADNNLNNGWDIGIGNTISYDANGNMLDLTRGSNTRTYAYYAGTNKVQNFDGSGNDYVYDSNANVTSSSPKSINTIAYDSFLQRPTSVSMSSGASLTLEYGGDAQRVLKNYTSGGSTNSKLYLHGQNDYPLLEKNKTSATAETLAVYIYGLNGAVAKRIGSTVLFLLKDHLGSTRVVMDATGLVRTYYDYDALGNMIRIGTTNEVKYQFTGQEYDESGVHNYRARLYDSDLGKFYAADPAGQFASPYLYAGNNPIVFVDPNGQFIIEAIIAAAAYAGGAIANDHGNFLKWDWSSPKTYGGMLAGGSLAYGGLALAGAAPIIGSGLAGATATGAAVGAGVGTGWGMVDIGNGRLGWDDLWKYTLTGSIAGATIGFGAQTGMFSFSPKALSWTGLRNSALFWAGAFASANSMESIEHGYQRSLIEGAVAGLIYGGISYAYVGLTDKLGSWGSEKIGLHLNRWGGYVLRTPINIAIARHAQAESEKQKLPGVDHAVVGAFLAGIPFMPFSQEGGNLAVLDDFLQTNVSWLGRGGQGSPLNTWYRKKFGKHRPWFPKWVKKLFP